jgi:hypothetical protein
MNTVSNMSTAILDAFDRLADSGVTVVEISYMGNQGDLKFLVWGTHAEGGGVLVSSFWGEQDRPGEMPDVPEGMAGQLIQILDPCNAR